MIALGLSPVCVYVLFVHCILKIPTDNSHMSLDSVTVKGENTKDYPQKYYISDH